MDDQRILDTFRADPPDAVESIAEEFRAGHLPRAISVPMKELEARMKDFPKDREIVAYCRGPYCVMAVEAVARLRKQGFRAFRLDMGVLDWQAQGLPVEMAAVAKV